MRRARSSVNAEIVASISDADVEEAIMDIDLSLVHSSRIDQERLF